jgi:hypothetical protein
MFTVLFSGAVFLSSLSSHRAGGAVNFSSLAPASLTRVKMKLELIPPMTYHSVTFWIAMGYDLISISKVLNKCYSAANSKDNGAPSSRA